MKIVIFGLTLTSSWGNGHATLWRGLLRALAKRGHDLVFFERNTPYYSAHRDLTSFEACDLCLYSEWVDAVPLARKHLSSADVAIVTSYCPDGIAASEMVLASNVQVKTFYDLDTPVTLDRLRAGQSVDYLLPRGLNEFDLVLSYTGGVALDELKARLGARRVAPLYGSVDPELHRPEPPKTVYECELSYLGTYAEDRQLALNSLFLQTAKRFPERKFLIAGAQYPESFPWNKNIFFVPHIPPREHACFYSSSRLTLNVARSAMAQMGFCPSGRLFEAAACGAAILTDDRQGLDYFFTPGEEIFTAHNREEASQALEMSDRELRRIAQAARERALRSHTAEVRAQELEVILESTLSPAEKRKTIHSISATQRTRWGIIPAAGIGSRIQPLAFSKELLPVGSRFENGVERPKAVSEYLVERMQLGGSNKICFVISPGKSDILEYYGAGLGSTELCYTVQVRPSGLCDALFRAKHLIRENDIVSIGLPDTIWFPEDGFCSMADDSLSFLLFQVANPRLFDAVLLDSAHSVQEIQVKSEHPSSSWIWGAIKMPASIYFELYDLWVARNREDEYLGTLVNAFLKSGGKAKGVPKGECYVDVGTLNGYREALQVLSAGEESIMKRVSSKLS